MKKKRIQLVIIFLFILKSTISFSQNQSNQENYYKWFDDLIGIENTGIYNGFEYRKKYRTLEGSNEFYLTSQFVKGNIVYDQQPYYDIEMKYDINEDIIIVKLFTQSSFNIIQLVKEKIESFSINNKRFVRITNNEKEGFYELLFKSNYLTLYKKHEKQRNERLDKDFVYYVFKDKKEYFIQYNQKYHRIKSKADFSKLFPEQKKSINSFWKNNKVLYNSDYDMFLHKLSKHIETLISTNTSSN